MFDRDTLLRDLREHVIEVTFIKADGTTRNMRCTLLPRLLPPQHLEEEKASGTEKKFHKENTDVIACWDVQANGWRSFRIDTVQWCQIMDQY